MSLETSPETYQKYPQLVPLKELIDGSAQRVTDLKEEFDRTATALKIAQLVHSAASDAHSREIAAIVRARESSWLRGYAGRILDHAVALDVDPKELFGNLESIACMIRGRLVSAELLHMGEPQTSKEFFHQALGHLARCPNLMPYDVRGLEDQAQEALQKAEALAQNKVPPDQMSVAIYRFMRGNISLFHHYPGPPSMADY